MNHNSVSKVWVGGNDRRKRSVTVALCLVGCSLVLGLLLAAAFWSRANAAPLRAGIAVNTTLDEYGTGTSACSLREAITAANTDASFWGCSAGSGADIIMLPAGTYTLTRANSGGTNEDANATGDLDINTSLTIQGAGAGSTIIQAGTNSTNGIDKVFGVNPTCASGVNVTIDGVTIQYGRNTQTYGATDYSFTGGGLDWCGGSGSGAFTLSNAVVISNTNVYGYGGGLNTDSNSGYTGAILISNVLFQNNQAVSSGGGGANFFGYQPAVTITGSTFLNNRAPGANVMGGGINFRSSYGGSLTMHTSVVSGNTAGGYGGGLRIDLPSVNTVVQIDQNSRFINNVSGSGGSYAGGGGIYIGGYLTTQPVRLSKIEVTGNAVQAATASNGGGGISIAQGNVVVEYSRIAGNTTPSLATGLYKDTNPGTVTATNNWWGCSTGPGAAPCNTAAIAGGSTGSLTTAPYLRLNATAGSPSLAVNQTTPVTFSFKYNSAGTDVSANLDHLTGLPVSWTPTGGTLSGQQTTLQAGGTVTGTYQATAVGTGQVAGVVDHDTTTAPRPNVITFTAGKAGTTVTVTSHSPEPSVLGAAVSVYYTVIGAYGNSPIAPTGTITVTDGVDSRTCTLPTTSCPITLTTGGVRTLTVQYSGDANFNSGLTSVTHTVTYAPVISKAFGSSVIPLNMATTLAITISNPAGNPTALTGVAVTDSFPAGLVVATPNNLSNSCGGTVTATAGSGSVSLSGGTVNAGSSCVIRVNVLGTSLGLKNNVTGNVSSTNGGTGNTASAGLTVSEADLAVVKSAAPTTLHVGNLITYTLRYTNTGGVTAVGGVISDYVPSLLGSLGYTYSGAVITPIVGSPYRWQIADLAPGAGGVITITGILGVGAPPGWLTNTVTISSTTAESDLADNSAFAVVTVTNQAPIPATGPNQSVNVGAGVTLSGSGSSDPDGHTPLTYYWKQIGGTAVSFTPNLSVTTFTAPSAPTVLTFGLRVTDSYGMAAPVTPTVVVTVTDIPISGLAAANSSSTTLGQATYFTATVAGGANVSYAWNFGDGQIGSGSTVNHTYTAVGSYTARVTATNSLSSAVATTLVTITNAAPTAQAGTDQTVNVGSVVTLNGAASSDPDGHLPLTYGWAQTGGPAVAFTGNLSVTTFTAPGTPTVLTFTLTVTDNRGLVSTPDTVVITVANVPISGLTAANSSPTTLGQPTYFTATIAGGTNVTYQWNFGDGQTAGGQTANHIYGAAGTYTARVTATNSLSSAVATTLVTITNAAPTAQAGTDQTVNVGSVVTLNGAASSDPDGHLPLTYGWAQTGGPAVAFTPNLSVTTFTAPGTPTVLTFTLTVTDNRGLVSTPDMVVVTVGNIPISGLAAANSSPTRLGKAIFFTATIAAGSNVAYVWDFGDGQTGSGATANHVYGAVGTYTARVTATNSLGSASMTTGVTVTDVPISGLAAANSSPTTLGQATYFTATVAGGTNVSYAWNFGDGQIGSGATVNHTYTAAGVYTARVTATNSLSSAVATTLVTITNAAPTAQAGTDQTVNVGSVVTLNGAASSDPDGHLPLTYGWAQTGGPAVAFTPNLSVTTFTAPGTPTVLTFTLAVTDDYGLVSTPDTVVVTVTEIAIQGVRALNDSPTLVGGPTHFSATIAAGSNVTYAWDFGDGQTAVGVAVTHTYGMVGSYTATVTATNSLGSLSATTVVTVLASEIPISGLAAVNNSPTTLGQVTAFTATVVGGSSVVYQWNFGDGQTAAGAYVNHLYSGGGVYTARVTATNSLSSVVATTVVTITNQAPTAQAGADQTVRPGSVVTLTGTASSDPDGHLPLTYRWAQVGGLGVTFTSHLSVITFTAPVTSTVLTFTLTVTDSMGAGSTGDTVVVTVQPVLTPWIYLPIVCRNRS